MTLTRSGPWHALQRTDAYLDEHIVARLQRRLGHIVNFQDLGWLAVLGEHHRLHRWPIVRGSVLAAQRVAHGAWKV